MHINYTKHGRYGVAIIKAPKLIGTRLGHLSMENDSSWAIRDYIGGVMLRSGDSARSQVSGNELKLNEIEAVVDDYYPDVPQVAVGRKHEWASDLESRSKSIFGRSYDAQTPPNGSWGRWKPLP